MGDVIALRGRGLPDKLSRDEARDLVKELVSESGRIFWREHALARMQERDVSDMQVLQVLSRGQVISDPQWSEHRNWQFPMEADTAGAMVRVVVALDTDQMGNFICIITVVAN